MTKYIISLIEIFGNDYGVSELARNVGPQVAHHEIAMHGNRAKAALYSLAAEKGEVIGKLQGPSGGYSLIVLECTDAFAKAVKSAQIAEIKDIQLSGERPQIMRNQGEYQKLLPARERQPTQSI